MTSGFCPRTHRSLSLPGVGVLGHPDQAVVLLRALLREPAPAELVLGRRVLAEPRLEPVHHHRAVDGAQVLRPDRERGLGVHRVVGVAEPVVVQHREVARALHVGLAAQRVHAAADLADVPEQELEDAVAADVLDADRVLGHPERVEDRAGPVQRERLGDLLDLLGRDARDLLRHLGRVARVVLRAASGRRSADPRGPRPSPVACPRRAGSATWRCRTCASRGRTR